MTTPYRAAVSTVRHGFTPRRRQNCPRVVAAQGEGAERIFIGLPQLVVMLKPTGPHRHKHTAEWVKPADIKRALEAGQQIEEAMRAAVVPNSDLFGQE